MPRAGFEPTIPVFERSKTISALDRAVTAGDSAGKATRSGTFTLWERVSVLNGSKLGGRQSRSGRRSEEKIPLSEIESRFSSPQPDT